MDKLKTLDIVGPNGTHTLKLVAEPPPHMMFLGSQVQSAGLEGLDELAAAGGLAALVVREFDGEPVDMQRLPRTLPELLDLGRGFIMLAFEKCGSYEEMGFVFTEVMGSLKVDSTNPT